MSTHSEIAARCGFPRLPLLAFLVKLYGKADIFYATKPRDLEEMLTRYVIAVYTSDKQLVADSVSRPYNSLEELKMNLDMRWPSNFLDNVDSKPVLERNTNVVVSMHQIKGIPQEDLLECYHSRKPLL